MEAKPLISAVNLVKRYTVAGVTTEVLKKISFSVLSGEMIAVVGASGSGKSTLMNILGLLDKACEGEYWLNQRLVSRLNEDEMAVWRNQAIGFVFQQFHLLPRLTAEQNVALPLSYRGESSQIMDERVMEALGKVGMADFASHRPMQLSGGQQQRVAIARALVGDPQVILADEPTGSLDLATGMAVMDLFLSLHQEGRTLIVVTHDEKVASLCQRRIMMVDGCIEEQM